MYQSALKESNDMWDRFAMALGLPKFVEGSTTHTQGYPQIMKAIREHRQLIKMMDVYIYTTRHQNYVENNWIIKQLRKEQGEKTKTKKEN